MSTAPLLSVNDLRTYFFSSARNAFIRSVDGVMFDIPEGKTLGLVGESGSGKTITALSIMGLLKDGPGIITGSVRIRAGGSVKDLLQDLNRYVIVERKDNKIIRVRKDVSGWHRRSETIMSRVRGRDIGMIFQHPGLSLNPYISIGKQLTEAIRLHTSVKSEQEAKELALRFLEIVKIDSPGVRFHDYPASLSGGMCQRVMIAMTLAPGPSVLIADEPTTALDATIQSKILDLLEEVKADIGVTMLLISHDISVISRLSDDVAVMYGGTVLERGPAKEVLASRFAPKHPYTSALLSAAPHPANMNADGYLQPVEGDVPDMLDLPKGCRFFSRCSRKTQPVREKCGRAEPDLREILPGHWVRCWLC